MKILNISFLKKYKLYLTIGFAAIIGVMLIWIAGKNIVCDKHANIPKCSVQYIYSY